MELEAILNDFPRGPKLSPRQEGILGTHIFIRLVVEAKEIPINQKGNEAESGEGNDRIKCARERVAGASLPGAKRLPQDYGHPSGCD